MFRAENIRFRTVAEPGPGPDGHYEIPHYKITDYIFFVVASSGDGWEHVSVSLHKNVQRTKAYKNKSGDIVQPGGVYVHRKVETFYNPVERCPTWEEMCFIKDFFWTAGDCVLQYHPPKADNVSMHPFCLHLWKPLGVDIPVPDPILVGMPGSDVQSF